MKRIKLIILLAFIAAGANMSAQKPITVADDSLTFGKLKLPGLVVSIPEVEFDRTHRNWIKRLQSGTKSKVVEEFGQMSIFGALFREISTDPLNIYSILESHDSLLMLRVAFELRKDQYIDASSGAGAQSKASLFLKQFAKQQYISLVEDQVSDENKKLRIFNGDLKSLQNEKYRLEKSIQANRKEITEEKDNIVIQNNELNKLTPQILEAHDSFESMTEGATKDAKASYIKDLEKRKKKAMNSIEASENRISRANSEIDQADRDIPKNESDQTIVMDKIAKQETVLQSFNDKLKTVQGY